MVLIYDEFTETWLWVEKNDHDTALSPEFDTEEDAMLWQTRMIHILCKGRHDIQQG